MPERLVITKSLFSPAQSVRARCPVAQWPPEFGAVSVLKNGAPVLEARCDRQISSYSGGGMALEIAARSKGAYLLDNEAEPRVYENITAQSLFNALIAPFGFVLVHTQKPPLFEFTVRKGWTLWDAFCAYTRLLYGVIPYVSGDMVMAQPPAPGDPAELGGDIPISSIERTYDHYCPISRVFIRNEDGMYIARTDESSASARGITRTRYLIPAGEYTRVPEWDAYQRLRRGMREMLILRVTVPGHLEIKPGQGVTVRYPQLTQANLLAEQVVFLLDGKGARTVLTLKSSYYYQ